MSQTLVAYDVVVQPLLPSYASQFLPDHDASSQPVPLPAVLSHAYPQQHAVQLHAFLFLFAYFV